MFRPLAAAALAALPVAAAAQPSAPLAEVSAHLRAVQTMTANFAQSGANGATLTGVLTLKRPGRVRFQYQKGVPLLVIGDGSALIMIDYQVAQVSRWPVRSTALGVLLGSNPDLTRLARVLSNPAGGPLLIEARDPKHPEFGTITIAFRRVASAPAGLLLEGWTVLDAQNNRSTVRLSNQRFNIPVSDASFRWTDPRPKRALGKG